MSDLTLESLRAEVDGIEKRLRDLRSGHEDSRLEAKATAKSWSAAEVCEHLAITWDKYRPCLVAHLDALREGGHTSSEAGIRPGWMAGKFIAFASPLNPRRLKAPKAFSPSLGQVGAGAIDSLIRRQAEIRDAIDKAEGLQLNRRKFPSPITALLRFTLGEGLLLMVRHQQRHLNQAERATASRAPRR